ncbi:MAG: cobalamin biosynthesis protein CbiD [Actinobacteria bacterium]|nr:cobalamin biosynthesis protein CbiD [Actinomycetota bacterium]
MGIVSRVGNINKKLRKGYTTGTCAAAAATAAVKMLFTGEIAQKIDIELPDSSIVSFNLIEQEISNGLASCGVVKDAGDDPDVTNGITIYAKAIRREGGISITAGEGIGLVTKPGLSVPVGKPAINPIPRRMIERNVNYVLPDGEGVEVMIYAPEGLIKAKKTFNERLGIVGGISILGTTGIVRPMSIESLKASLLPQVDIALAMGYKTVALVPGNMGARSARIRLKFPADAIVQMGNFVGSMLDHCAEKGVERIILMGHIGKMAKVAAGYFNTHSRKTDDPVEIMKRLIIKEFEGAVPITLVAKVNTAEDAALALSSAGYARVLEKIAEMTSDQASSYTGNRIEIGTAITVLSGDIIALDAGARRIVEEAKW